MAGKTYTLKATNTECRFDTDELDLSDGNHRFVVKAKARGFLDSEYSNEVVVNVGDGGDGYTIIVPQSVEELSYWDFSGDVLAITADGNPYYSFPATIKHNNPIVTFRNYDVGNAMEIVLDNGDNVRIDPDSEAEYTNTGTVTITAIYKT